VGGSFVADSAYNYICIGVHFLDDDIVVEQVAPVEKWQIAYYWIDDVCVSDQDGVCATVVSMSEFVEPEYNPFPNPVNDVLYFPRAAQVDRIEIANSVGAIIQSIVDIPMKVNHLFRSKVNRVMTLLF
jgi:hypothetical protein